MDNTAINPAINTAINPAINPAINADFNAVINSDFNPAINAVINSDFNPAFNAVINSDFNPAFNPANDSHSNVILLQAFAFYLTNHLFQLQLIDLHSFHFILKHFHSLPSHFYINFNQDLFHSYFILLVFQGTCGSLGRTLPFSEKYI
jgi:hypothetical protein